MDDRVLGYHHVQNSPPWVVGLVSLVAILLFSLTITLVRTDQAPAWLLLLAVLSIAAFYLTVLSAARLTTRVTLTTVKLAWRLGWPSKTIDRAGIVATTAHRNSWIAGWGIRKVSRGWMWNVWGLDAVELELEGGSVFRIGTDDQSGLLTALGR
jgi:hypothetical protein